MVDTVHCLAIELPPRLFPQASTVKPSMESVSLKRAPIVLRILITSLAMLLMNTTDMAKPTKENRR